MVSTLGSTQADPRFDGGVAPTVAKNPFTGVDEALARLAYQAASDTPDARPRGPASDRTSDARISQSFAAATLGPADLRAQIPREQRSLGKRGTLARVAIAVCLGASAIWAWPSYSGPARDMIATWARPLDWISARLSAGQTPAPQAPDPAPEQAAAPATAETPAPPPAQAASQAASIAQPATTAANEPAAAPAERQQIETMARDLAALHQTVEQLAAGQEQLTREIAKLQAEKPQADKPPAEKPHKRMLGGVSAPGRGSDVFDPAQNPNAPGVPHTLGSIVLRRRSPRRRASPPRQRRWRRKPLLRSRR
jgi:pyruvate/2-oxoglutarate dehydrogenase complex dihydrolipoamide acyltransferase (E2) component